MTYKLDAGQQWLRDETSNELVGIKDSVDGEERLIVFAQTNPLTGGVTIPDLDAMTGAVTASRALIKEDSGQTLICTSGSAIVLTIPNDSTVAWAGLNAIASYQGGAGAVSFAAGSGVTLRGTAPTAAQYATQGVMRVGENEWAYL